LQGYNPVIVYRFSVGENTILIVWNFNPYAIALVCTGILSLTLCVQLFLRWSNRECVLLGFAMLFISEWCFFVGFESAVADQGIKILFAKFSYFGVYNCLPFVFLFVLYYFGFGSRITPAKIIILWIIPFIIILLAATNEFHHLIWSAMITPTDSAYSTLVYLRGPIYPIGVAYNYVICISMSILLFIKYRQSRFSVYRSQALLIFISTLPPWLANFLYILRIPELKNLDFTPFGFFFTGLLLFLGLNKFRMLAIAPVARDILFDSLSDGIIVLDASYQLMDLNKNGRKYLKYSDENWMGISLDEGVMEIPGLILRLNTENPFHFESNFGSSNKIEIDGRPISDEKRRFTGWLITIRDITTRKKAQKAEIERRQFAEALRDVSLVINSTLNLNEVLERILSSVFEFLPCTMANIALVENGVTHVEIYHGYLSQEEIDWVKAATFKVDDVTNLKMMAETGKPMFISDTREVDYFTNPSVLSYMGAPIIVRHEIIGYLNLDSDRPDVFNSEEECERLQAFADLAGIAIDNARMYQSMKESAVIDSLTGINNRRNLLQMAEKEFERSNRYNTPISIIMLDIDNFKLINDTCGHLAGDMVITKVGIALSEFIRRIDIAGRYGGDEFCIVLPETSLKEAKSAAQRLLDEFHKIDIPSIGFQNYLQASLGVASKDENTETLEDVLARADKAMYQAKKRGRNRVESAKL
jgi:diguanylate cyclase (GGDEF)-like protein/PAS domain S-box-containing protein